MYRGYRLLLSDASAAPAAGANGPGAAASPTSFSLLSVALDCEEALPFFFFFFCAPPPPPRSSLVVAVPPPLGVSLGGWNRRSSEAQEGPGVYIGRGAPLPHMEAGAMIGTVGTLMCGGGRKMTPAVLLLRVGASRRHSMSTANSSPVMVAKC